MLFVAGHYLAPTSSNACLQRWLTLFSFFSKHFIRRPCPTATSLQYCSRSPAHSLATYVSADTARSNWTAASYSAYSHCPESLSPWAKRPGYAPLPGLHLYSSFPARPCILWPRTAAGSDRRQPALRPEVPDLKRFQTVFLISFVSPFCSIMGQRRRVSAVRCNRLMGQRQADPTLRPLPRG